MTRLNMEDVKKSIIDISNFKVELVEGKLLPVDDEQCKKAASFVENGHAVFYGINKILPKYDLSLEKDLETARGLFEAIFDKVMSYIDIQKFNVLESEYDRVCTMDFDGLNVNKSFSAFEEDNKGRDYVTNKGIHFDAATPFVANIYGPNVNISGGYPIICNTKQLYLDQGIQPENLVENVPTMFNVVLKKEHYHEALSNYSFGLKMNLENDLVMVMLSNEVAVGVAHAATTPRKSVESEPALRPIRHIEYQYKNEEHLEKWYQHYGLQMPEGKDYDGKLNLSLNYHDMEKMELTNIVDIHN